MEYGHGGVGVEAGGRRGNGAKFALWLWRVWYESFIASRERSLACEQRGVVIHDDEVMWLRGSLQSEYQMEARTVMPMPVARGALRSLDWSDGVAGCTAFG